MKNASDGLISILGIAKKRIMTLKIDQNKIFKLKGKENKEWKDRTDIQELWNKFKRYNLCITGIPEGEENREKEIFEASVAKNFPKSMTDTKSEIQEVRGTPTRISTNKSISRHITFKLRK